MEWAGEERKAGQGTAGQGRAEFESTQEEMEEARWRGRGATVAGDAMWCV